MILGLVALEGGSVGEKGVDVAGAGALGSCGGAGDGGGQCLLLASLRSIFLRFSTAAMRKKLTVILIIVKSAFYTFTLLGVFGEFLWQTLLLH